MDAIQAHLALNHFPVILLLVAVGLLIAGWFMKQEILIKAAFVIMLISAVFTIPVYTSGEEAEERVEHLAGTSEHYLEEHEELGESFMYINLGLGILAALSLVLTIRNHAFARIMKFVMLILVLFVIAFGIVTADHGGKIRHSELIEKTADF